MQYYELCDPCLSLYICSDECGWGWIMRTRSCIWGTCSLIKSWMNRTWICASGRVGNTRLGTKANTSSQSIVSPYLMFKVQSVARVMPPYSYIARTPSKGEIFQPLQGLPCGNLLYIIQLHCESKHTCLLTPFQSLIIWQKVHNTCLYWPSSNIQCMVSK